MIAAVKDAGYLGATTVDPGVARPADPYKLPRIRVNGSDGVAGFEQKLAAAVGYCRRPWAPPPCEGAATDQTGPRGAPPASRVVEPRV